MLKEKRFLIPVIALYAVLITVMIVTAVKPALDYDVSRALTSGGSVTYTIGNILEIWAEPVTLLPMCFIIAAASVFCIRSKAKGRLSMILGSGLMFACAVLSYQVVYRIVKYHCKLVDITRPWTVSPGPFATDKPWVKAVCALAGLLIACLFVYIASRIPFDTLKKTARVLAFCVICLLAELAIIEGMKLVFGRMRYREWISRDSIVDISPWYRMNGKPASDAFKSFPSGHTANSFLIMPMTFFFDALGKRRAGNIARICHLVWMAVVMTSRIMAGAHFLSDVACGMLVSLTIVTVCGAIIFRKKAPGEA